jgi:hypothetical protein
MSYYLCRFEKDDGDGIEVAFEWTEAAEAEVGKIVYKVNDVQGLWRITNVGDLPITKDDYIKLTQPKLKLVKKAS